MTSEDELVAEALLFEKRLHLYQLADFRAALHGEKVPYALGTELSRLCIIRGIRYNYGFAEELRGKLDVFTRALNARSIMSNVIPTITRDEEVPYCIWHPDVASEKTYRDLAKQYPQMIYQVGRACAVAGYTTLFAELEILPEVHIAEEARECGSTTIFESIMAKPMKYNVMNDYTRSIELSPKHQRPGVLNGDTCVRWMLGEKQAISRVDVPEDGQNLEDFRDENFWLSEGYRKQLYNITEDMAVGEDDVSPKPDIKQNTIHLLYTPLPSDLPTVEKDRLILLAAYHGNIDRYTRLRRPERIQDEAECISHGIYFNTMFAKWWSLQPLDQQTWNIAKSLNARFIMNNDLSRITQESEKLNEPYLIWHPDRAKESTYRELARLKSTMRPQILRACIVCKYKQLFDELIDLVQPDPYLLAEASLSSDTHYKTVITSHMITKGLSLRFRDWMNMRDFRWEGWKMYSYMANGDGGAHIGQSITLAADERDVSVDTQTASIYPDGHGADLSPLDLFVSIPDDWKKYDTPYRARVDYVEWPSEEVWQRPTLS